MKRSIKADERNWMDNITREAEKVAKKKKKCRHLRAKQSTLQSTAALDRNGKLLSEKMKRWTEHFEEVLNGEENPITSKKIVYSSSLKYWRRL